MRGRRDDSVIASNQAEKGKLMPIQIKSSTNAAAAYIAFFSVKSQIAGCIVFFLAKAKFGSLFVLRKAKMLI